MIGLAQASRVEISLVKTQANGSPSQSEVYATWNAPVSRPVPPVRNAWASRRTLPWLSSQTRPRGASELWRSPDRGRHKMLPAQNLCAFTFVFTFTPFSSLVRVLSGDSQPIAIADALLVPGAAFISVKVGRHETVGRSLKEGLGAAREL